MNIFFMPAAHMLVVHEGAGGLFDFNATLPLMALQFILLTTALTPLPRDPPYGGWCLPTALAAASAG